MKDLIILLVLVAVSVSALRAPWIGVMGWTLVSLMSPHVQFGYAAASWPVATGIAICTLVGTLACRDKQNPMIGGAPWFLLAFTIWICITLPFSIFFDESIRLWVRTLKTFLFIFVSIALITDLRRLNIFIWINVISIAFYGVKGGAFTILSGGNYRVWGPGGFIEGNNEVALAVITVVPLMRYLQQQMQNKRAKLAMSVSIGLCVVMTLGTYSRGALLGVAAMGGFFWLRGTNKMQWGVLILAIGLVGLSLMPDQWWDRMNTIKSYQADTSALGRINAWWMAFNLAKDRIFGGGFFLWTGVVFQMYAPVPDDVHAAHSIYFQVLGEHGFIGLFLFMAIGASTWWTAREIIKSGRRHPELRWAVELGAMIQVSMIGYAVTGAFLSLSYYDLPYNVMVMAVVAVRLVRAEVRRQALRAAPAGTGPARHHPPPGMTT